MSNSINTLNKPNQAQGYIMKHTFSIPAVGALQALSGAGAQVKYTGTDNIAAPTDVISTNTQQMYDRNLLRRAVEQFVISKFTAVKAQPKHNGKSAVFSIYDQIADTVFTGAVLADGTTPSATDLTKTSVKADITNHGAFVELTDEVDLYHEDGKIIVKEATDNLGAAAGTAIEKTLFAEAVAGAGIDIVTVPPADTWAGLRTAETTLRTNLGKKFKKMITGSKNTDTKTIREAYIGFCHPTDTVNLEYNGAEVTEFTTVDNYGYSDGIMDNEVGSYRGIRFIETVNAPVGVLIVMAEESLGEVSVRGKGRIQTIVKGFASGGTEDALNQRQSVAAKYQLAAKVLRPTWIAKIAVV